MFAGSLRHRLIEGMARRYLEQEIADPELRRELTPDYPLGCKRVLVSDDYYQAIAAGGIEIVTSPIVGIGENGVLTDDGVERPVDVLIYGTGFRATEFLAPLDVRGRDGRRLADTWRDGAWAQYMVASTKGGALPLNESVCRPSRLPEPLLALRPQHQPRAQFHHLYGGIPGALYRSVCR